MRRFLHQPAAGRPSRSAGFSLIEMLVGLAVTSMLLLAIVGAFGAGSKIARVETQLADVQQSLRASHRQLTRFVRMAGRGGLPLTTFNVPVFQGPALTVRNAAGRLGDTGEIAIGYPDTPSAVKDSDILIVRGVFTTPIYQIDNLDPGVFTLFDMSGDPTADLALATDGTVTIGANTPTGLPQDLSPLISAIDDDVPEALVLVSPMAEGIIAVVELDAANSDDDDPNRIDVGFKIQGLTEELEGYRDLYNSGPGDDPVLPSGMNRAVYLGILEEYRFYVRQPADPDVPPGDDPIPPSPPKLSMARMFPGTETPHLDSLSNLAVDLADNVLDMQLGLAFDSPLGPAPEDRNGDGDIDEDDMIIFEDEETEGLNDDWLFNNAQDDTSLAPWNGAAPQPELYYIRLSLLARSFRRELKYQAPELVEYEDILDTRIDEWNTMDNRMYHRRFQQTIIELRNL